jgi:D-alanyl-D-alanine carboxypeptidase/D-alanyl-D-alanine-endopeptidase (penicillin-binding protein 4)
MYIWRLLSIMKTVLCRVGQGLLVLGALVSASAAWAQGLPQELQHAWRATRLPESSLSLVVKEVDGPALVAVNPSVARNPASVMKMVTTWAGLATLGPDYTWRTTFLARDGGRVDEQGSLRGPLYLKAGGDPLLSVEELWGLLRELRLRGIKNLTDVVVDRSLFGAVSIDPGAFDAAPDRPYNASPDAMMVGLGVVRIVFQPDDQARKWIPIIDPPIRGLRVAGEVQWRDAVCPGSPSIGAQVSSAGRDAVVTLSGTAIGSCGEFSVYRLATTQPAHFSALFKMLWRELGGTIAQDLKDGRVPAGMKPVAWHDSESLADMIRRINKQSNNVMARTLLLTMGAQQSPGATERSGAAAAMAVLEAQGVDTRGWVIGNGSGLSREGRLTATGLAGMLDTAWRSSLMPEFMSSLAISGVDGTVRRRLRDTSTQGMAHLKTGTLRDASALAGYVLGASGKRYVLVSMVNGEGASAVRTFNDAVIAWLTSR